MNPEKIENLLPQTQCRQCGYDGCTPYAHALAAGKAAINLCTPGGEFVINQLATLLKQTPQPPAQAAKAAEPKKLAYIDENECIGCTACIKVCPVDAILGASKQMHTVLADECTGCELCLPPCPVDCIVLIPVSDPFLPRAPNPQGSRATRTSAASHARKRYQNRILRQQRRADERQAYLKEKQSEISKTTASSPQIALIARAMAAAKAKQHLRTIPANYEHFRREQITAEQEKAAYRRAQRNLRYGSEAEKQAAIQYLQQHKNRTDKAGKD